MDEDTTLTEDIAQLLAQAGAAERMAAVQTDGLVALTSAILSLTEVVRAAAAAHIAMAAALQQDDA